MSEREMVARAVREALGGCADIVTALALVEAPSTLALASTLEVTYDLATKLQAQVMTLLDEARAVSESESDDPVAVAPVLAPVPARAKGQPSAQPSGAPVSRSPQQSQSQAQSQQQQQEQKKREYPEDGPPDPALMAELAALAEQVGKSLPRIATQKQGTLTRNHYMKLAQQQVAANRARS